MDFFGFTIKDIILLVLLAGGFIITIKVKINEFKDLRKSFEKYTEKTDKAILRIWEKIENIAERISTTEGELKKRR